MDILPQRPLFVPNIPCVLLKILIMPSRMIQDPLRPPLKDSSAALKHPLNVLFGVSQHPSSILSRVSQHPSDPLVSPLSSPSQAPLKPSLKYSLMYLKKYVILERFIYHTSHQL